MSATTDAFSLEAKDARMRAYVEATIPAETGRREGAHAYWHRVNRLSVPEGNYALLAAEVLTMDPAEPAYTAKLHAALAMNGGRVSSIFHHLLPVGLPAFDMRGAVCENPRDFAILAQAIGSPFQEIIKVAFLDEEMKIVYSEVCAMGSLTACYLTGAMLLVARQHAQDIGVDSQRVIISHNHPSGDVQPSSADVQLTRKMKTFCDNTGLELVDHIITDGGADFYSFREHGLIQPKSWDVQEDEDEEVSVQEAVKPQGDVALSPQARMVLAQDPLKRPWEVAPRRNLSLIERGPWKQLAAALRQGREQDGHAVYLNTKNRIVAIEQITDYSALLPPQLYGKLLSRAAMEGATGFLLRHAAVMSQEQGIRQVKALRMMCQADEILHFHDAMDGQADVTTTYRDYGVMEDAPVVKREGDADHNMTTESIKTPQTHPDHHTVGHHFSGTNWERVRTEIYFCDSYDPCIGYWMTNVNDPDDRKNVSERAIDRTFHRVEEREDHWRGRSGVRFEKADLSVPHAIAEPRRDAPVVKSPRSPRPVAEPPSFTPVRSL